MCALNKYKFAGHYPTMLATDWRVHSPPKSGDRQDTILLADPTMADVKDNETAAVDLVILVIIATNDGPRIGRAGTTAGTSSP